MASRILASAGLLLLAACSSFGPSATLTPRALDPLHDDLGGLLVAFDLPRGLGPVETGQSLSFLATGGKPVIVRMTPADADEIAAHFPPPGNGHAYYAFAFAPADGELLRAAESAAAKAAVPPQVAATIVPKLCTSGGIDTGKAVISVLVALPGGAPLLPMIDHRDLDAVLGQGVTLPACS